jgi:hypothetical protein
MLSGMRGTKLMKSKTLPGWPVVGAFVFLLTPVASAAAESTPPTLRAWLEDEFFTVGKSCLTDLKRPGKGKTAVPSDVLTMATIARNLDSLPKISPETSVRGLFAEVYKDGARTDYQPIATAFNESSSYILYENRSNLTIAHNCTTMFSGAASTDFRLNTEQLRIALSSSYNTNVTETGYVYAGRLVSPITRTLNLNSSAVDAPSIDHLAVWLSLWHFYRTNPAAIADAPRLQLLNEFDGVAMLRYRKLNQTTLLNGVGSVGLSVPFFAATAKADASANIRQAANNASFSIAYWLPTYVPLPSPGSVIDAVPRLARFVSVGDNPKNFVDGVMRSFAWDVSGVPSAYCTPLIWNLVVASGSQTSETARVANLSTTPTPDVAQSCRFRVDVTPPSAVSSSGAINVTLNLVSTLPTIQGARKLELKLSTSNDVPDFRASVAFRSGSGPTEVTLAGDNTQLTIVYPFRERNGFRATGIVPNSASIRLTCVGMPDRTLAPNSSKLRYENSGNGSSATLAVTLPADLPIGEGASAQCSILGEVDVNVNVTSVGERTLTFPSHTLVIRRPAVPVRDAVAEPQAAETPGRGVTVTL